MVIFGSEIDFTTLAEAEACWSSICDSIEDVQYTTSRRGMFKKRRSVTKVAQQFMSRCDRMAATAKRHGSKDADTWKALASDARSQYQKMLEYKEKIVEALDQVY